MTFKVPACPNCSRRLQKEQDPTEPPSIIRGHSSPALPKASNLLGHEWSPLALLLLQEWQESRKLPLSSKWVHWSKSSYR